MLGRDPIVVEGIEKEGDSSSDAPSRTKEQKGMEATMPADIATPELRKQDL